MCFVKLNIAIALCVSSIRFCETGYLYTQECFTEQMHHMLKQAYANQSVPRNVCVFCLSVMDRQTDRPDNEEVIPTYLPAHAANNNMIHKEMERQMIQK